MYLAGVCANIAHLAKVSPRTTSTGILARTAATSVSDSKSKSKYGGRHVVTLIPGDGVGPELAVCVKEVFRQANVPVDFEEISISGTLSHEDCLNEAVVSIERNGVGLCGTLRTPIGNVAQRSLNVQMRVSLDLFANVVHCKTLPNIPTRHKDVNIAIIRENTEGEYSGLEHEVDCSPTDSLLCCSYCLSSHQSIIPRLFIMSSTLSKLGVTG
jgi:isocitrate dehydrogenase (NAD+)